MISTGSDNKIKLNPLQSAVSNNVIYNCLLKVGSKFRILMLVLVIVLPGQVLVPLGSYAQTGGYAGSFSRIGFGPRGLAMGNAMSSVIDEGAFGYYNPASVATAINNRQVDLSTSVMSFDRSLHMVNGVFPLPPKAGISISILNGNVSDFDGRTNSGYHTGTFSTNEYQLGSSFGLRLSENLQVGVGIKYYIADYQTALQSALTFGFDLGAIYRATDRIHIGLAVKDLLAEYTWDTGGYYGDGSSRSTVDTFPVQARLGTSYSLTDQLFFTVEPGLLLPRTNNAQAIYQLRTGGRYKIHEQITVRGGWQIADLQSLESSNNLTAGFSIHLPFDLLAPSIDYAFVPEPSHSSTIHVFGLQLNI